MRSLSGRFIGSSWRKSSTVMSRFSDAANLLAACKVLRATRILPLWRSSHFKNGRTVSRSWRLLKPADFANAKRSLSERSFGRRKIWSSPPARPMNCSKKPLSLPKKVLCKESSPVASSTNIKTIEHFVMSCKACKKLNVG